ATPDFGDFDARLRANPFHRFDEVQAKPLLDEREHVALLAADEAVVAAARRHGEVVVFALMEGTGSAEARAHALELDEFADDRDHVGFLAHARDDVVRDHANSAIVT